MLILRMDISHLMVHAEQMDEQKLTQVGRELKNVKIEDGHSFKIRLDVQ